MADGYTINIVGEQNYQNAVRQVQSGEAVFFRLEPDNPHDEDAIAVVSRRGETLGYIPRDSFIQRIVHEEDRDCLAEIHSVSKGNRGFLEIRLQVRIKTEPETCIYSGSWQDTTLPQEAEAGEDEGPSDTGGASLANTITQIPAIAWLVIIGGAVLLLAGVR